MSRKGLYLIIFIMLLFGSYIVYNYAYKAHRDIANEVSIVEISPSGLLENFKAGDPKMLLNKTITVKGKVTQVEGETLTLNDSAHFTFMVEHNVTTPGVYVTIKGRCIGYDDLFEIVKIDQCSIVK